MAIWEVFGIVKLRFGSLSGQRVSYLKKKLKRDQSCCYNPNAPPTHPQDTTTGPRVSYISGEQRKKQNWICISV